jgi:hypothetical protein
VKKGKRIIFGIMRQHPTDVRKKDTLEKKKGSDNLIILYIEGGDQLVEFQVGPS